MLQKPYYIKQLSWKIEKIKKQRCRDFSKLSKGFRHKSFKLIRKPGTYKNVDFVEEKMHEKKKIEKTKDLPDWFPFWFLITEIIPNFCRLR